MTAISQTSEAREYAVQGMTCAHCVPSVGEEVSEVAGVQTVHVDLASARMIVTGRDIDDDAIRAAVAGAGYEVGA